MGGGASMLTQGGDIADGKVDANGKPKTFSLGAVATDAAIGGATGLVGGPLISRAFKAAPTVVGGAMALGVASGGKKAYDSYKEGHGWSALAEGGMTATAVLPFANRKSLTGMFGAQARAQTMQTGAQVWNGAKNLGNQAIGGVRNLAASEGLAGVRALGNQAWGGAKNLGTQAVNGVKNWGAQAWSGAKDWGSKALDKFRKPGNQGSNEGAIRDVSEQDAATVWGAGPGNTAPKAPTSEPDVGLSNRGYQPKPGERSTTKEQWKAQSRAARTSQQMDELAAQGHGPQRHGPQITERQLDDRAIQSIDPASGTKYDAYLKNPDGTPKLHKAGKNATNVTSSEAYVRGEDCIRNSQRFKDALATADKNANPNTVAVDMPLEEIYGLDYKSQVFGKTRIGSAKNPQGTIETDFTDGTMKAVYRKDSNGEWKLHTMYPEPQK
jgi:hypothetical protein